MDLFGKMFNNSISKRVNEAIAEKQSTTFANALQYINMNLNDALPVLNYDAVDYYAWLKTVGAFYEVTDAICKKVCASPIVAYKIKDKKKLQQSKLLEQSDPIQSYLLKQQAIQEVDVPELTELFTKGKANPYQTGSQFMWTVVLSYLCYGNTYVHANRSGKKAKELYCFPNMQIDADTMDMLDPIRGYTLLNNKLERFPKEEIQHIKTGNASPVDITFQYLYGIAPLRAYLESLRSIKEGKTQSSKQARNGGVFGVLSPRNKEDNFGSDQNKQLKEKLVDARKSDDELSRILPSSISLSWQNIGLPIGDLQLLEMVGANEKDIYRAFHWPLNFHDQNGNTFSNQGMATKQAIYDAVAPICTVMGEAFTVFLADGFGCDYIEWDYTQLPEMAIDMKAVSDYVNPLVTAGIISPNEARIALKYGEDTEAYMNEKYVNSGRIMLRDIYNGITS